MGTATPAEASVLRVLFIDDEPILARAVTRALKVHEVVVAAGGPDGAERALAAEPPFDVVLCDLMMPEMAGWDVFDAVVAARPEMAGRFLFLTGGAYSDQSREFLARPDIQSLPKPFNLTMLRDEVRRVAAESTCHRASASSSWQVA